MGNELWYPTAERITEYKITEYNLLALDLIKVKKADKPKVLSYRKILDAIEQCNQTSGDIYDKAAVLLKELVQKHPFASGNRRTAFVAVKDFLLMNKSKFGIKDDPAYAKVMTGIREGYYSKDEIKEWLKNGKIREFRR